MELSNQLPGSHPLTAPVHPPERVTGPPELHHSEGRYPGQHSDGNHQQQPIDPLWIPQPAARQLEHSRFLIAEQLLSAEALGVTPDPIQRGLSVADQITGFLHR
jgi:hypothetical protein